MRICCLFYVAVYRAILCIARTVLSQDAYPSIHLSVTRRYCVKTAKHTIRLFFHRRVAMHHSSFFISNVMAYSHGYPVTNVGVECRGSVSCFISEMIQDMAIVTMECE